METQTENQVPPSKETILETIRNIEIHFNLKETGVYKKLNEVSVKSGIITNMIKDIDNNLTILLKMKFESELVGKDTKYEDERIAQEKAKANKLREQLIALVEKL